MVYKGVNLWVTSFLLNALKWYRIFNWYMYGLTDEQIASEKVLIEQFRDAMIDYD